MTCLLTVSYISITREPCLNDCTVLKEGAGERDKQNVERGGGEGRRKLSELCDLKVKRRSYCRKLLLRERKAGRTNRPGQRHVWKLSRRWREDGAAAVPLIRTLKKRREGAGDKRRGKREEERRE